jgi:chromosome segregation ATPase
MSEKIEGSNEFIEEEKKIEKLKMALEQEKEKVRDLVIAIEKEKTRANNWQQTFSVAEKEIERWKSDWYKLNKHIEGKLDELKREQEKSAEWQGKYLDLGEINQHLRIEIVELKGKVKELEK